MTKFRIKLGSSSHQIATCVLLLALLGLLPSYTSAQENAPGGETITKVGTTAAQFLKIGVGARAISMGGTFVAEASDLSAMYWNPAGIAGIRGNAVDISHTQYLADIQYNHIAFGTNLGSMGTVAVSLIYLDSGDLKVRTIEEPEGTGELFKTQDFAIQMSYGRNLTDRFSVGGSLKYIREQVWHSSATAVAFDVGVLFTTPYRKLRLGSSISNFGNKMQMSGRDIIFSEDPDPNNGGTVDIVNARYLVDSHPLPLLFRVGLAWDAMSAGDHRLVISTDAAHPNDNSEYINTGAEYGFRDLIMFRGGYRNLFETDGEEGFTFGGGLNLRVDSGLRMKIDYAYADFGRLDQTHWFTLGLEF